MKKKSLFFNIIALLLCALFLFAGCTFETGETPPTPPSSDGTEQGGDNGNGDNDSTTTPPADDEGETPAPPTEEERGPITAEDFLSVNRRIIVNQNGEEVLLKGTNFGGWLHFEGWMDGGGGIEENVWGNHYAALTALRERFTDEQVEELLQVYQTAFIQESDFDYVASLGLNLVRIPFFWTEIMDYDGNVRETAFDQLDFAVNECRERGMYILLDLHGAPGGHSGGWTTGGHTDSNELWTNETYQAWTVKIWEAIATHYKDEPAIYGYGLLNEPVLPEEGSPISIKDMYDKLYKVVRAIDQKHIIVMGAFFNFDTLGSPHLNGWKNVVYETHHYDTSEDYAPSRQNYFAIEQLGYIDSYSVKWNVPVLAGEFNFWTAENAWRTWLYTLSARGVSWCNWTYKNTEQNADRNWGLFHQPTVEYIDYDNDTYEEIAEKWRNFKTENYTKNEFLKGIFEDAAKLGWDSVNGTQINASKFKTDAYQSETDYIPAYLMDGDILTYWSNGEAQEGHEEWVEFDAGKDITLNRIDVFCLNGDFAREIKISVFKDGEWVEIATEEGYPGNVIIRFDTVTARRWRIEQTSENAGGFWWRIYEICTYLEIGDIENEAPMPEN